MFACDRAVHLYAQFHDLVSYLVHALNHIRIAWVKQNQWVQVAIAGMKNIAYAQVDALTNLVDLCQHWRQPGAPHSAVYDKIPGTDLGYSPERTFARKPDILALIVGFGQLHFTHLKLFHYGDDLVHLRIEAFGIAIGFDNKQRLCVSGESRVSIVFHDADHVAIHHLQCGRH